MNCFECDKPSTHEHHIVPQSLGGTKTIPLCSNCHGKIHNVDLTKMDRLRELGKRLGAKKGRKSCGHLPYGWDKDANGNLIENAKEQEGLFLIKTMRAQGQTYRFIARYLQTYGYRPKLSTTWHAKNILNMVKRDFKASCYLEAA